MKAPSIYTVLSNGNNCTSIGNTSNGNNCTSIGKQRERGHVAENKKNTEESSEETQKSSSTSSPPLTPQPQAVGGMEQGKGVLTPEEIWDRTCRVLGRSLEKPISRPEQDVLHGCALWLNDADLQVLEADERRLSALPNHRHSQTAYSFLSHAATRLARLRSQAASQAAPTIGKAVAIDKSNEEMMNRTLPTEEIWQRICRLVGNPGEVQTERHRSLLDGLHGIREWTLRLVERYMAHEKKQRGSRGPRSVLTLLKGFDLQLRCAENWDTVRQKEQPGSNRRVQGDPPSVQPSSQQAPQPASPAQVKRAHGQGGVRLHRAGRVEG